MYTMKTRLILLACYSCYCCAFSRDSLINKLQKRYQHYTFEYLYLPSLKRFNHFFFFFHNEVSIFIVPHLHTVYRFHPLTGNISNPPSWGTRGSLAVTRAENLVSGRSRNVFTFSSIFFPRKRRTIYAFSWGSGSDPPLLTLIVFFSIFFFFLRIVSYLPSRLHTEQ